MIDLGKIEPGSTIRIPFGSYTASTGASSATTNYAAADIQIYKDGGTTQRASASGITATADFDALTGINLVTIDLADNTTADFYASGSEYIVVVSDVTIDSQTVRFPIARFEIGFYGEILGTTIATLASQTSFTLTNGSADNSAYVGCVAYIHDAASAVQCAMGVISAYTGSTKTVTLAADPGIFTIAAKDNISIFPRANVYAFGGTAVTGRDIGASVLLSSGTGTGQLDFTSGVVKANATQMSGTTLTARDVGASVLLSSGTGTGQLDFTSGVVKANATQFAGQTITCSGGVTVPAATLASTTNITAGTVTTVSGNVNGSVASVTAAVAITSNIKKNQALSAFEFMMTDSTNHAPATGKTVTVTRSIDGGAFGAGSLSAVTEVSNGIYKVDFAAGDLNGNVVVLRATATACDDTFERIVTQP